MTEILSDELNDSNRMPFLHLYIALSFIFGRCGHFAPPPPQTAKVVGSVTGSGLRDV